MNKRKSKSTATAKPSPRFAGSVPDGFYDNRNTAQRELYHDGKVFQFLSAGTIYVCRQMLRPVWSKAWGYYPGAPNSRVRGDATVAGAAYSGQRCSALSQPASKHKEGD